MYRRRASSQALISGVQGVLGHRARQGVFPAVGVLPREYADRRSARFVRHLFGPVCPRYLREPLLLVSVGAAVLAFLALASPLLLGLAWIPFAIPSAAAGVLVVFVDERLIPAPTWLSSDEVRRLRRRLYLYRGLSLVFMAVGLGGASSAFGPDGFLAAGAFLAFGVSIGTAWIFLSSRLLPCPSYGGLTVYRRARGAWICLLCRRQAGP